MKELPPHHVLKSYPAGHTGDRQVAFFRRAYAEVPKFVADLRKNNVVNVDSGYLLKIHQVAPQILLSKDLWLGHFCMLAMNRTTWDGLAKENKEVVQHAAETAYKTLGPSRTAASKPWWVLGPSTDGLDGPFAPVLLTPHHFKAFSSVGMGSASAGTLAVSDAWCSICVFLPGCGFLSAPGAIS